MSLKICYLKNQLGKGLLTRAATEEMLTMSVPLDSMAHVRRLARSLIASHRKGALAVALATAAALLSMGQIEYAEVWQQVASAISVMLGGT